MEFITQNWEMVYNQCYLLFEKIRQDNFYPDVIIGIARGGWIPARLIADFFLVKFTANLKVEAYELIGENEPEALITQSINANLENKKVLVVDDVADTGVSLEAAFEEIKMKNPKSVKVATLYYKERSKILPEYYLEKTDAWIIFAWEYFETIEELSRKFGEDGLSPQDIQFKLKQIGIPSIVVDNYFK